MKFIEENELISRHIKICENCQWCVPLNNNPYCLLRGKNVALFSNCKYFKWRIDNKISM